jgi:bacterioferritin-associated ferredoxin
MERSLSSDFFEVFFMPGITIDEIKKRRRVVCICRAIPLGKVQDAIAKGASNVEEVNRATGTGKGDCEGSRCRPVIEELLARVSQSFVAK